MVQVWLKIVKEETRPTVVQQKSEVTINNQFNGALVMSGLGEKTATIDNTIRTNDESDSGSVTSKSDSNSVLSNEQGCYKLSMKDGKQVLQKIDSVDKSSDETATETDKERKDKEKKDSKDSSDKSRSSSSSSKHKKSKSSSSSSSKEKSSSSSKSSHSSSSSSKDKYRDKDREKEKSKDRSSSKSSSSSSTKDKHRDKDRKDRDKSDKHRNNGESKKSSSSSSHKDKERRDSKEKQAEKDKDTLSKIQSQQNSIQKLGRIPKKGHEESSDSKKKDEIKKTPSISIEVRKSGEDRPKTVKVFNSKMRCTGLLDEVKPPPPRSAVTKKVPPTLPTNLPVKRSSPIRDAIPPPEKRSKLDTPERPGAIKLIPPKPKRKLNLEHLFKRYFLFFQVGFHFVVGKDVSVPAYRCGNESLRTLQDNYTHFFCSFFNDDTHFVKYLLL